LSDTAGLGQEWGDGDGDGGDRASGAVPAPAPAELYYATVEAFVRDFLVLTYRRPVSATSATWCAQWWCHPEAVLRLEALWRSWEHLRQDPTTGSSVWLRDHADRHMGVLLSSDGPFKGCTPEKHSERPLAPLPVTDAPEGMFAAAAPGPVVVEATALS